MFLFSPIVGMMIESDFHIFQGDTTNHQLDKCGSKIRKNLRHPSEVIELDAHCASVAFEDGTRDTVDFDFAVIAAGSQYAAGYCVSMSHACEAGFPLQAQESCVFQR
jgi:hypothetical protein